MERGFGGEAQGTKSIEKMMQLLDVNYGCIDNKDEDKFQKKCMEIQQVKTFYKYYQMLGITVPDDAALRDRLQQAISNSRKKGYHGSDVGINELPTLAEQASQLLRDGTTPFTLWNEEKKEFAPKDDPKWQKACEERFLWIEQIQKNSALGSELKPY